MQPAASCILAAGLAWWCAAAAPADAQRQWLHFDGAATASPGVSFTFSRPSAVYDPQGLLAGPNVPRFEAATLFCALPRRETLTSAGSINVIAAGMSDDGVTPVYVVNGQTDGRLSVHVGRGSVERAFRDGDWSDSYGLHYRDASKGNEPNLLVGQTGANGGTPDVVGMAFTLTNGGAVHNGLIVLGCDIYEPAGSGWASRRAGLAYTTVERLEAPDPWIVTAVGPNTGTVERLRGSQWSLSAFPLGDGELIVVWSDYRMSVKTGGIAHATRFRRIAGEWAAWDTVQLDRSESPVSTEHWHGGGVIRHPDGRESYVISTGDGIGDNRLIARTRPAHGGWASPDPLPDTGIDERSRLYPAASDWTEPVTVWGGQGLTPGLRHNQAMAMIAADPACSALLCGSDETSPAVLHLTYDPDTLTPRWRTLYLPSATSWPGDGVLNFCLDGFPGGPYLGRIDASGASQWDADERETRVLFSPDGVHWGQCLVAGTTSTRKAVLDGETAYIGAAASEPVGFRSFAIPEHLIARPLAIAPSGGNLMSPLMTAPDERVAAGVTVTPIEDRWSLPPGVPPLPCDDSNIFMIDNASTTGSLGVWLPTRGAAIPGPESSVLLRAWLYALPPSGPTDPSTTAQLTAELYDSEKLHLDVWTGREDFDAGAWTPLTVWAHWTGGGGAWVPEVYLKAARANTDVRFRCLVAWEGLYLDAPTVEGHGLPPGGFGAAEDATIEGLDFGGEWTLLAAAMLPDDQWDNRVGGGAPDGAPTATSYRPQLFALETADGGSAIRVLADPRSEGIVLAIDEDGAARESSSTGSNFWLRGSPVLCVLRSRAGVLTMDCSVGGSEPIRLALPDPIGPEVVRLGPDPVWFRAIEVVPAALDDQGIARVLETMTLRCPADFDANDTVDTRDVLAFLNAWNGQAPEADFNGDGRHDTLDVLAFLNAFASGC